MLSSFQKFKFEYFKFSFFEKITLTKRKKSYVGPANVLHENVQGVKNRHVLRSEDKRPPLFAPYQQIQHNNLDTMYTRTKV